MSRGFLPSLCAIVFLSLLVAMDARPYAQQEYFPSDDLEDFDLDTLSDDVADKRSVDLSVTGSLSALSDMLMWQKQNDVRQQLAALGKRSYNPKVSAFLRELSSPSKRSGSELSVLGSLDALSDMISSQRARKLHNMMSANHQRLLRLGKRDTSASLEAAEKEETKKNQ